MKDTTGYSNWETRRMMDYAHKHNLLYQSVSVEYVIRTLERYERKIKEEGFDTFVPYYQDQVNWWEIVARLHGIRYEEALPNRQEDRSRSA